MIMYNITNPKYKEILKLDTMLTEAEIPHTLRNWLDGWQVCYPVAVNHPECIVNAIEHYGSYGSDRDRLEIMGLLTPEEEECSPVLGHLTAEEVFERIRKHYNSEWDDYIKSRSTLIPEDAPPENPTATPTTPEEFKQAMTDAYHKYWEIEVDEEFVHIKMDEIMCNALRSLGYGEGIDIFENTPVWYS